MSLQGCDLKLQCKNTLKWNKSIQRWITFNSSSWIRNRRVSAAIGDILAIFSSALGSQESMDCKVKGDAWLSEQHSKANFITTDVEFFWIMSKVDSKMYVQKRFLVSTVT